MRGSAYVGRRFPSHQPHPSNAATPVVSAHLCQHEWVQNLMRTRGAHRWRVVSDRPRRASIPPGQRCDVPRVHGLGCAHLAGATARRALDSGNRLNRHCSHDDGLVPLPTTRCRLTTCSHRGGRSGPHGPQRYRRDLHNAAYLIPINRGIWWARHRGGCRRTHLVSAAQVSSDGG